MKNKLKKQNNAETAVKLLVCFILGIYPLILFDLNFGNFHLQELLLFLCVMGSLLYSFMQIKTGEWKFKGVRSKLDLMGVIIAAYTFLRLVGKVVGTGEAQTTNYDFELAALALTVFCFLLITKPVFKAWYFDVVIFSGLIVFVLLLVYYLCGDGVKGALAVLIQDKSVVASYTILICMIGLWQYCQCEDKRRRVFYGATLLIAYFVLFLNQNHVSIWLMGFVFIAMPIVQRTTADLIKKDMQMFFAYLFLLCNMCLITNYTDIILVEVNYGLEQSVYLELLVAVGAAFFFKHWDKIPEGIDLKRLVMRKMRREFQFLLTLLVLIFWGIAFGGMYWSELSEQAGVFQVKSFITPLSDEILHGKNTFYYAFDKLGFVGSMLFLVMCVFMIKKLQGARGFDKPVTSMLFLISCVYLIQLLFWKVNMVTLPMYSVFVILAISYKEESKKITSRKIKLEQIPVSDKSKIVVEGE